MSGVKAHGLSGDWVQPDWPALTIAELAPLLRRFPDAGGATRVLTYSPRPFSAASVVETPRGRVFVKRHHELVRDREGLLEEHRFIQYLGAHGAAVPPLLADEHGETVIRSGPWTYEVHSVAEGIDLYEQDLSWTPFRCAQHARAAGRALAQLHCAARGYQAPPRQARTLVSSFSIFAARDPRPALLEYVMSRPSLAAYLGRCDWQARTDEILMGYHAGLRGWLPSLTPLWTHNDFHASNLMWSSDSAGAQVTSVIDFGLSDRTNAVHDIATALERNAVNWLSLEGEFESVVHVDQIDALLAGYEEIRTLTSAEAHALVAMLPLVHAEFALSEADYFAHVLMSDEKAALAWDGYFLGHAAWFRSAHGERLLRHLAHWAERHATAGPAKDQHVSA